MKSIKTIVYLTQKIYSFSSVLNLKTLQLVSCSLLLTCTAFAQNGVGVNTLVPKSSFDDVGSFGKKVTNITATTTLSEIHSTVVCDNTSDITVTLPTASSCARRIYEIKRSSISTNLVTISGTIDGVANYLLSYPNQSITIFSDSTKWLSRDGSGDNSAWKLTGNAGTVAGTNFIGTTDAVDWVVKTTDAERMRVLSTGFVGINTTPTSYLHVRETSAGVKTIPLILQNRNNAASTEVGIRLAPTNSEGIRGAEISAMQRVGNNDIDLKFSTSDGATGIVERMRMDSDGDFGINNTNPTSRLHVIADGVRNANYSGTFLSNIATSPNAGLTKKGVEITSTGVWGGATTVNIGLNVSAVSGAATNYDAIFNGGGNVGIGTLTPNSLLEINGSFAKKVTTTATSLTLNATHSTIVCENVGANITLTLPAATGVSGRIYDIKKNSASTGTVTLSGTIDGVANLVLTGINTAATVFSDGTEWKTMQGGSALNGTAWGIRGNTGINPSTNFLGTTDTSAIVFRVNNSIKMKIQDNGRVGIGNSTMSLQQMLTVQDGITLDQRETNDGTIGNPCLRFGSFAGEGIGSRRNASVSDLNFKGLDFYTTTKIRMSILGLNNGTLIREGNVGINTLAPTARLHVVGQIQGNPTNTDAVANYAGTLLENIATANFAGITKKGVEIKSTGSWAGVGSSNIGLHVSTVSGGTINYDAIFNAGNNVGIGTNTPTAKLDVETSTAGVNVVNVQNTSATGYSSIDYLNNSDTLSFTTGYGNSGSGFPKLGYIATYRKDFIITHLGATTYDFYLKGAITGAGLASIGIGTNDPQQNLSVFNGMNIDQAGINAGTIANTLRFGSNSTEGIGSKRTATGNQNGLDFYTNSTNRMVIENQGDVGIGTTDPACRLDVRNDATGTTGDVKFQLARSTAGDVGMDFNQVGVKSYGIVLRDNTTATGTPGRIAFVDSYNPGNAGTEIMCIGPVPNGFVGIGINAPEEVLHLYKTGVAPAGPAVLLESNGGGTKIMSYKIRTWDGMAANTYVGYGAVDDGASSARAAIYVPNAANNGVTEALSILKSSGNVGVGCNAPQHKLHVIGDIAATGILRASSATVSTTITACSDIRFKKDITHLDNALSNVLKLNGVTYNWKKNEFPDRHFNDKIQIGVIAQELEKVYPELVSTDTDGYKSVDYSKLTPILIEALKEQQSEINTLKTQQLEMYQKMIKLESKIDQNENNFKASK